MPVLFAAGVPRRLLPRRHAPGQFACRQRGPHRRGRFRHHGASWASGAAVLPRGNPDTAFIRRDYLRVAEVHFEAGYVPRHYRVQDFAQAIRAIGDPIHSRPSEQISMARLLTLLFEVTALFEMSTRTELVLLQKTMVVVEGVARKLDPRLTCGRRRSRWSAAGSRKTWARAAGWRTPAGARRPRSRPHRGPRAPRAGLARDGGDRARAAPSAAATIHNSDLDYCRDPRFNCDKARATLEFRQT